MSERVVVGVGGGIAAYKSCELIRRLKEGGSDVRAVPTEAALRFVGAATFEALSGHPVDTGVFERVDEVQHVRVGKEADALVIAPATADLIARLAGGFADDLLTATALVATCPVVLAPAMHTEMWLNPAVKDNVETLRRRGVVVLEPASGRLTGSDSGPGRMLEPAQIADATRAVLAGWRPSRALEGRRVVVTAGGTRERLDPVRYLGNFSSGRQGFALAEAAAQAGAEVTLVAAATDELPTPAGTTVERVESARELEEATRRAAAGADAVLMAAAVADVRPAAQAEAKLKKSAGGDALASIELQENPDIVRGLVAARKDGELPAGVRIVCFAAETGDETASAREFGARKLKAKGADLIMVNEVGEGGAFGSADNEGWLMRPDPEGGEPIVAEVPRGPKLLVAGRIVEELAGLLDGSND
ncbi:bifunctional phosphopantothenoylcysteine decarboxylase/phosphopantothenate--cysteine ligase CoaBC [Corynebacterium otitidis]